MFILISSKIRLKIISVCINHLKTISYVKLYLLLKGGTHKSLKYVLIVNRFKSFQLVLSHILPKESGVGSIGVGQRETLREIFSL